MIFEKPAVGISVYRDVFDANLFIEKLEEEVNNEWSEIEWIGSSVGPSGSETNYRTSASASMAYLLPPYPETELSKIFVNDVKSKIDPVIKDYIYEYQISSGISEIWHVLKYTKGAEYKAHYDKGPGAPRVFSMVAYLSDVEEGGSLEFPYFDVDIPSKNGTVVLFPSCFSYLHIAHPVEKGIKYSLVSWFGY